MLKSFNAESINFTQKCREDRNSIQLQANTIINKK